MGWVDEVELCKLWNQIQSLDDTVDTLVVLVNQLIALQIGRRRIRELLPFVNSTNTTTTITPLPMTSLEVEVIAATKQTYNTISPCCFPKQDCNETAINNMAVIIGSYQTQLETEGNITQTFKDEFDIQKRKLLYLDSKCGNPTESTETQTITTESLETQTVTTESLATQTVTTESLATKTITTESLATQTTTTEYVCCPEFIGEVACESLCASMLSLSGSVGNLLAILGGRRHRQKRSFENLSLEAKLLNAAFEAEVIIENCVENHDCNVTLANELTDRIHNIARQIVGSGIVITEDTLAGIRQTLRKISAAFLASRKAHQIS